MRKLQLLCTLVLSILLGSTSNAQDFSNKGKEFWLCFPQHVPSSTLATLSIWITSDRASSGMVTMTNGAFSAPFNIPANGLQEIQIPHAIGHISNGESGMIIQKSIKIKTDPGKPAVVAYAQQWGAARSAATLLLPTNVLGKKYYATSFNQLGVAGGGQLAKSQFQIIATKDNTVVKITPRTNGTLGASFIVNFPLVGDMYQYQADQDLTGTLIESTGGAGGAGCLPIAVFSGSSNITFGTNSCAPTNSYDPLFQQQYPISTWGKNFGFIPFGDYPNGNPYRVLASEDNTSVFFDGFLVATLNEGQIYPAAFTSMPLVLTAPTSITADKPIAVMQYAQNRDCSGSGHGDPDMVILNPIEQNIDKITVFTSTQQNINRQWINVLIKTIAAPTFTIDGVVPSTPFLPSINIPGYSYLTHMFSPAVSGSKLLRADSGFNAILYGFQGGQYESYAYSAGTYVKDPYRQIGFVSQYGIDPSVCVGSLFKFKLSLPYCADSIQWDLSNLPPPTPPQPPISIYSTCVPGPGGPDSTTVVNGKTLYWYSLPLSYTVNTAGIYNITITTFSPNTDGCGSEQEFDFELNVYDPPVGDFTWTTNGCVTQPVQFTETTPQVPKTTYNFWWDFGDLASGPANNSNLRNPTHTFSGPGTYTVSYVGITTPGCLLDTVRHQVTLNAPPVANFTVAPPLCINVPIQFTDISTPGATINQWAWDFGDGGTSTLQNPTHTYLTSGTFTVTLLVYINGCASLPYLMQITIGDNGTITLTSGAGTDNQTVCVNTPITDIIYTLGGGATGGSVSGLPTGVTGTFAGGVITITGTPTVIGTFIYSITTTGACNNPTATGTITVDDDGTLTLSSAPGTDNQTVCINTPIVDITYAVGGSGTGGSVSGLPAGVTGIFAGGVITITGTPTVSGTFNYTVTTTGPCINPTASGRIIVTDDGTITLTSAPGTDNQTVCINTPIINITYAVGGSGTGGSVSGLPAGVTGTFAGGVITITGTPTVSGTFNYTVTTTGPCVAPTATGTITVDDDGTLTLSSAPGTDNQTVCINTPIVAITYTVGGGGTGGSVSGLPAGVTGIFAGGVITITGIPTVSGTFNYIVTTTGPCINPTASGRIIVTDDGTITLTSAPGTDNQTVCINTQIINITYAVGGSGTGGSVSGLPAGVTGTFAGGVITITGTPTVSGTFNYTVTTTGPCVAPMATGTIIVEDDGTLTLTSAPGTDNQTVCINTPIVTITYTVGGGGTGGSVSGLPAGVTGIFAGGVITITGTPTVSGTFNYTVTTTGPCINPTASGRIIVTDDGTITLTSAPGTDNQTVCINTPIVDITYAVGGSGTGGSVSGLPAGVTGTFAGGVMTITGTPTVSGTFNYTVTTTGPCVAPMATGTIIVEDDGTLTLTSAPGTDNQTVCINTPIVTITYTVGGGGTGGSVSGLPAGVTGIFAGGVITITGTPTVSGTFNYIVTTTGPCINPTASGRIIVTDDGTITLTSAPGTDNQTVCINTPIVDITYAVGGSGTGGSVSGLPAGVTGTFAGGVITITGTPTVSGTFNYTVTTTGPCVTPSATGTITVDDDGTLTLSSAPGTDNQTVCINTPIVTITYTVGGGGTGGSVSGLPAGVTGIFAGGVITITGIPTVSGTFNYTVTTTGPCINPTASGRIIVTDDGTITLTSAPGTDNQTVCINTPIVDITYAVGGSGTGGSVSGLPAGVTGTFAGGVITITGTPTVSGTFNYTVSTTGPCVAPSANGTITVTDDATITLTSGVGTDNQNACINNPIIPITYAVGGSGTGGSVSGLPAGVTGTFAGGVITISGSPSVNGIFNYTVTTTGPCVTPTATGTINVTNVATIALTSAPGTDNQTVCINTPIINITYLVGGSGTGGSVTGLPAGVTGSFAGGIITITGSPTVVGTFNYTVNTTGPCGTPSANGTITVNDNSTLTLSSAPGSNVQTVCINTAITSITYAVGGGGTGASITAGALPAGVNGVYAGGVFTISGTPTVSGIFNFTVGTTGPCINTSQSGTITVTADATLTLTSAPGTNNQTLCINTAITNITYAVGGSGTGGSVSGLPAGVTGTFAGGIITITGTPSAAGIFNYTVNTTGPCVIPTANGTITVNDNSTLSLTSAPGSNVQTVCINTAITNITYAVGGGGTGASITAGALPAGVSGSFGGGVFTISGTPTVSGIFNFTITTTGPCINPTANGTITVTADATLTLTSAPGTTNQTVCINTAITNITYAVGGTGTGGSVSGLPAGVTGTFAGGVITITGTPSVAGTFNYTVTTTGPCVKPTATGTITVNDNSTLTLSSAPGSNVQTVCINTAIANITYAVAGGGTGASITAGALPAGVSGVFGGGVFTISGTPTASGIFNFTVGTAGPCINASQSGTITVTADGTLTLTSAPGTDVQTVCINTAIANIRYAIGGSGTGASITAGSLPAGVNGVFVGGVFTISGIPTLSGTFNFTVGNAGPCVNPTLTGTITINPDHAISLSSAVSTTNQTVCSDKPIAPIAYTVSGGASGATVTGLPPGVTSSVSGSTLTISGNPTIAGLFNYSVITTGNSCITASASGSISVLQTPAITFNPVAGVCADVPAFQVTASPAFGVFSGPGINATGLFNPAAAGAGNHIIRYTYTAANGCVNFKEQTLAVFPMPPTNAGPDKFMLEGGQVMLTPALNANMPVTYLWTPAQYLSDPNIAYTIASPPFDYTYTLTVTTDNGCAKSDDVFVKVLKAPAIPNIFSPNGDGVHDTWVIEYLDTYPGSTVDIFNRYGQKIFHSDGYTKPWDGTINGNPVPIGTYYYIVNPKNGRKIMSGYVDVIR